MKKFLKKILSIVSTIIGCLIPIGSFFLLGEFLLGMNGIRTNSDYEEFMVFFSMLTICIASHLVYKIFFKDEFFDLLFIFPGLAWILITFAYVINPIAYNMYNSIAIILALGYHMIVIGKCVFDIFNIEIN